MLAAPLITTMDACACIHHPSSQGWAPGVQTFFVQVFCCLLYVLGWRDGEEEDCYLLDGGMGGRRVATHWMEGCGGRRVATYFFAFFSILLSIFLG